MSEIASKGQLRMSFLRYALVTVPLVLLLGTLSGVVSNSGYQNLWFDILLKPSFMPPPLAFPIVWTTLYILLGLSLAMVLHARGAKGRGKAISLFLVQLLLNYSWSPIFFGFHKVRLALMVITAMIVLSLGAAVLFARIRKAAALLMVPYIAWLLFAAALNFQIMTLNPDAETLVPGGGSANIEI